MKYFPAKEGQWNQHQHDCQCSDHRPTQHLIDPGIDHLVDGLPASNTKIFSNPIKDHDRIGQRIACQRQQCGNNQQGNLFIQNIENSQYDEHIVKCCKRGRNAKTNFKPRRDIEDNPNDGDKNCHKRVCLKFLSYRRSYFNA